jgi:hypothetical protein
MPKIQFVYVHSKKEDYEKMDKYFYQLSLLVKTEMFFLTAIIIILD